MDKAKRKRLEARGWRVGTASDFLRLSPEEAALVEMKVRLSHALLARREARSLSQVALAKQLRSSQSRAAQDGGGRTRPSRSISSCGAWSSSAQRHGTSRKPSPTIPAWPLNRQASFDAAGSG